VSISRLRCRQKQGTGENHSHPRHQRGHWLGKAERIAPTPLTSRHFLLLALAALLLVVGAVREVTQWCGVTGGC